MSSTRDWNMLNRYGIPALIVPAAATTFAIILWMHSIRLDVGAYNTVRIFLSLFLFQDYPVAVLFLPVLLVAAVPSLRAQGLRAAAWAGENVVLIAAVTFVVLAALAKLVYQAYPLAMDEYAAVFQSRVFADGRIYGQLPPDLLDALVPKSFQGYFLKVSHATGAVASTYWPGFALLLTPFTRLGVTWLANPLLGAITIVLIHRIALRLTVSTEAAGLAVLLTLASPAVTVNAISLYSMPAHLACNAAFVLLLLEPTFRRAVAAGAIGSLALVLHNPLPHMLVAAPWLVWLATRPDRIRLLSAAALGYAPLCIALGLGWPQVLAGIHDAGTATATVDAGGQSLAMLAAEHFANAVRVFRAPALDLLEDRLMGVVKLWLWAVPGLLLLSLSGAWQGRVQVRARLLAWSALLSLLGFLFVPADQGHGWGYRYFHGAWFTLPVLAVIALWPTPQGSAHDPGSGSRTDLAGYMAACSLLSLTLITALRLVQVGGFIAQHRDQIPAVQAGVATLVLIDWRYGYYSVDLVENDPFLRNTPVIMLSQGSDADAAMIARRFPGSTKLASNSVAQVWGEASH